MLPINAVILQRNGSGQGESTNRGTKQHPIPGIIERNSYQLKTLQ